MNIPDADTPEPTTLGQRLDVTARATLARRDAVARRLAARERPARRWDAPADRRLRVEADVPPAWDDAPARLGDPASPASSGGPTAGPVPTATARAPMPRAAAPTPFAPPIPDPVAAASGTPSVVFPPDLAGQLAPLVGPGLERVAVHDGDADPAADAAARAHGAAALTVGQQIFLRQGRFRPRTPQGRALLAHEAMHAAEATRPGTAWRRATASGRAGEERAASAVAATIADRDRTGSASAAVPPAPPPSPDAPAPVPAPRGDGPIPPPAGLPAPLAPAPATNGDVAAHPAAHPAAEDAAEPVVRARRLLVGRGDPRRPAPPAGVASPPVGGRAWPTSTADQRRSTPAAFPNGTSATTAVGHRSPADGAPGHAGALPAPSVPAAAAPAPATSAAATPMAAPADRPAEGPAPSPPAAPAGDSAAAALRALMRRVRTDRERGA
ncbi:eCIS core domain-containing protein [Pseudonocardia charpentierae]|uniref:DUF4157 domain-containing protein n=1 Tax=Pseudonocardia charpentierae TaxID=3075545 RepID=A0ABU2NH88_9PSEU|nr:DUF4157 domain-containing protein [Pseudonocardia sp. DSM 45834]MDT0353131.1 DUF4157 domain-containing protein [Pseudonocardia sp. DSM 45834]